jgi:hypothetical protein
MNEQTLFFIALLGVELEVVDNLSEVGEALINTCRRYDEEYKMFTDQKYDKDKAGELSSDGTLDEYFSRRGPLREHIYSKSDETKLAAFQALADYLGITPATKQ